MPDTLTALVQFYERTDLITQAVAAERTLRAADSHRTAEEIKAVASHPTSTQAAIDRYLAAFENGTLDERTCGQRGRDLTIKLDQLTLRHDELTEHARIPPKRRACSPLLTYATTTPRSSPTAPQANAKPSSSPTSQRS